jgi:CheY-like chemotaxis protein
VESTIAIHPKRVYFLDVRMGPDLVITTKVDDQYVTYIQPPSRQERRMERELFGDFAQKGTEKYLARSKELEDQYGIKGGAHLRASLKDLLAGGKGLPADPRDYEKVTVTVVPVPGADWSDVRNQDPWYAAEAYGGVGGLKVDGQDAYEKANSRDFNLVLTDQNMPRMDGISLTKKLRESAKFKSTPILILTTESSDQMKQAGRAAGATGPTLVRGDSAYSSRAVRSLTASPSAIQSGPRPRIETCQAYQCASE